MISSHLGSSDLTAESLSERLSKPQAELLAAMRAGAICHGMFGIDSYYFRSDTMRRCSAQVKALLSRGLVEEYDKEWRGCKVRAVPRKDSPANKPDEPKLNETSSTA